jgi:xylulokinase
VRAVMEGVAYSLRHLLDLCALAGQATDEIALAAGGAATPGWPQILADVCQRDVCIYAGKETVTRVLYALCQQHLGHGDLASSLSQTFNEPQVVHPDRGLAGVYDRGYGRYREFVAFARAQAGLGPGKDRSSL